MYISDVVLFMQRFFEAVCKLYLWHNCGQISIYSALMAWNLRPSVTLHPSRITKDYRQSEVGFLSPYFSNLSGYSVIWYIGYCEKTQVTVILSASIEPLPSHFKGCIWQKCMDYHKMFIMRQRTRLHCIGSFLCSVVYSWKSFQAR